MKDIVVDNSVTCRFSNPLRDDYKLFASWLNTEGCLAVSKPLLLEIKRGLGAGTSNILPVILHKLQQAGRLNVKTDAELDAYKFTKARSKEFKSGKKDHVHIKLVMLSCRRLCLTEDKALCDDVNLFVLQSAVAADSPHALKYSQ